VNRVKWLCWAFIGISSGYACEMNKVGKGLLEALRVSESVQVVVALGEPSSMKDSDMDTLAWKDRMAAVQEKVLSALDPCDFQLSQRYESIPAFSGRITQQGLEKLVKESLVVKIDLDVGGTGATGARSQ
jgi:hypothetical protein